jgi:outer membrane receptor protein involved in Fe transport
MRLSAGVRGDATRSVNEGGFFGDRSIPHQDVAATGAVTAAPTQRLVLTAQVARGFRDPTLTDRFSRGPVGRGFLEGNPDLVPETSRQFDVTARYDLGRVDLGAAWYRYDITDLVERYLAAPDLFRMRNRGHARLEGIEIDARVEAGPGLTLDLTATTSRGRDTTDATPLDDIAPGSVGAVARHVWRQRLSSYVRVTAVSGHRHAGPSEVSTPGYTLVDAAAAWRVSGVVDVRATLRNALDASYYSSAGPRWVWAPGRQLALTVVLSRPRPRGSDAATSSR